MERKTKERLTDLVLGITCPAYGGFILEHKIFSKNRDYGKRILNKVISISVGSMVSISASLYFEIMNRNEAILDYISRNPYVTKLPNEEIKALVNSKEFKKEVPQIKLRNMDLAKYAFSPLPSAIKYFKNK